MSNRADFEAKTGLKAIKANAIKLCGQKFVDDLKETGITANHKSFWRYVNQKLEIPEGFEWQKKEEEWRQIGRSIPALTQSKLFQRKGA